MLSGLRILEKSPEENLGDKNFQVESTKNKPEQIAEESLGIEKVLDQIKKDFQAEQAGKAHLKELADEAKTAEEAAIRKSQEMQVKLDSLKEGIRPSIASLEDLLKRQEETSRQSFDLLEDEYQKGRKIIEQLKGLFGEEISEHDPILNKRGEIRPFKTFASKSDTQPLIRPEDLAKAA